MEASRDITRLLEIMAALRTPGTGCPWDLEQNFATIAPYTLEEAYEVADAIARGDLDDLREELGDLLLQVAFHARMAEEQGAFDFGGVVEAITEKLAAPASACVRRSARAVAPRRSRGFGSASRTRRRRRRPSARQRRARRRAGRPPCPDARAQAAAEGRQGRIRLERSARGAGEDPRGGGRDRGRHQERQARRGGRRGRRPVVRGGQPRPPSRCRSGSDAARRPIRNSSGASPSIESRAGGARQDAGAIDARRDGRAVG